MTFVSLSTTPKTILTGKASIVLDQDEVQLIRDSLRDFAREAELTKSFESLHNHLCTTTEAPASS